MEFGKSKSTQSLKSLKSEQLRSAPFFQAKTTDTSFYDKSEKIIQGSIDYLEEEKQKDSNLRVLEAQNKINDFRLKSRLGDDEKQGWEQTNFDSDEAKDFVSLQMKRDDEYYSIISKNLSYNEQQRLKQKDAVQKRYLFQTLRQKEVSMNRDREKSLIDSISNQPVNFGDANSIIDNRTLFEEAVNNSTLSDFQKKEVIQEHIRNQNSEHLKYLIVNRKFQEASELLAQRIENGTISNQDALIIENSLKRFKTADTIDKLTQELLATGKSREDLIADTNKISDPDVREGVTQELNLHFKQEKKKIKNAKIEIWKKLFEGQRAGKSPLQIIQENPVISEQLTSQETINFFKKNPKANAKKFYDFINMGENEIKNLEPNKFFNEILPSIKPELQATAQNIYMKSQGAKGLDNELSNVKIFETVLKQNGFDIEKNDKEFAEALIKFNRYSLNFQDTKGRKLTADEIEKFAEKVTWDLDHNISPYPDGLGNETYQSFSKKHRDFTANEIVEQELRISDDSWNNVSDVIKYELEDRYPNSSKEFKQQVLLAETLEREDVMRLLNIEYMEVNR